MILKLYRKKIDCETITGNIVLEDNSKLCDTLERDDYCIPAGVYRVVLCFCKHRNEFVPLIKYKDNRCQRCTKPKNSESTINAPASSFCPMFSDSNGVLNVKDGRICVGQMRTQTLLINTRFPYKYLMDLLHSGERIVLEIFDPQ